MTIWFTADSHYGHDNIRQYCNRPFDSAQAMDEELIKWHNMYVLPDDIVYHLGDFTLKGYNEFKQYINRLNGTIYIVPGSHDWRWLNKLHRGEANIMAPLVTLTITGEIIVLCHYAMRVFDRSHYNSWQLYGHSHGMLEPVGKQMDVGVDNINKLYGQYRPISLEEVRKYMLTRPDNPNLVKLKE